MEKRIRTVNTAYAELISKDPNTAITKNAIRSIVNAGKIPSLQIGNKTVFDLDDLEAYIRTFGKLVFETNNPSEGGCIV